MKPWTLLFLLGCQPALDTRPLPLDWTTAPATSADRVTDRILALSAQHEHIVVRMAHPLSPIERKALDHAGLRILTPLGADAYIARIGSLDPEALTAVDVLGLAMPLTPERKLSPHLEAPSPWAVREHQGETWMLLDVILHPDVDLDAFADQPPADAVATGQASVAMAVELLVHPDAIHALAEDDRVQSVAPVGQPLQAGNDSMRVATQANIAQAPPFSLSGAGVQVMVFDVGNVATTHPDLAGRVLLGDGAGTDPSDPHHPTHIAGIVAGNGAASAGQFAGVAPQASILSYGWLTNGSFTPGDLYNLLGDVQADWISASNLGADLATSSVWSAPSLLFPFPPCAWMGDYAAMSVVVDSLVYGSSLAAPMPTVWITGNDRGVGSCGTGFSTIGPPGTAKNPITVGAIESDTQNIAVFSGFGPTDDGRLKPDVVAPGDQSGAPGIRSTADPNPIYGGILYTDQSGTSQAAPAVAGGMALLMEDWRAQFPGQPDPSNAMFKAWLTHTATDLGNPGPDYQFGYGAVQFAAAATQLRTGNSVESTVLFNQDDGFLVQVPAGTTAASFTLAWDDVPSTTLSPNALLSNLDLVVTDPAGNQFFPWTLNPAAPAAPAVQTAPDSINNVEQVTLTNPVPGTWQVQIRGTALPIGQQAYALTSSLPLIADCNLNGTADIIDVATATSADCNANLVPDECGEMPFCPPTPGTAGSVNTFGVTGGTPTATVFYVYGTIPGTFNAVGCTLDMANPTILTSMPVPATGNTSFSIFIPPVLTGAGPFFMQAIEVPSTFAPCRTTQMFPWVP